LDINTKVNCNGGVLLQQTLDWNSGFRLLSVDTRNSLWKYCNQDRKLEILNENIAVHGLQALYAYEQVSIDRKLISPSKNNPPKKRGGSQDASISEVEPKRAKNSNVDIICGIV
jgi:hypothetical protein